jgi:hypothetical protein
MINLCVLTKKYIIKNINVYIEVSKRALLSPKERNNL